MVRSKTPALRGKGEAYGPWEDGRQVVYRVWAVEAGALWVSVLGTHEAGQDFRPGDHDPLSPPFLIDYGRVISVYLYPPGLTDHGQWPRKVPTVTLPDTVEAQEQYPPGWHLVS